jgi:hypothetical protein
MNEMNDTVKEFIIAFAIGLGILAVFVVSGITITTLASWLRP